MVITREKNGDRVNERQDIWSLEKSRKMLSSTGADLPNTWCRHEQTFQAILITIFLIYLKAKQIKKQTMENGKYHAWDNWITCSLFFTKRDISLR